MAITYDAIVETHSDYYSNLFIKNMTENGGEVNVINALHLTILLPIELTTEGIEFNSGSVVSTKVTSQKLDKNIYEIHCTFAKSDGNSFPVHKSDDIEIELNSLGGLPNLNHLAYYIPTISLYKDDEKPKFGENLLLHAEQAPAPTLADVNIEPEVMFLGSKKIKLHSLKPGQNISADLLPGPYTISAPAIVSKDGLEHRRVKFTPKEFIIKNNNTPMEVKISYEK